MAEPGSAARQHNSPNLRAALAVKMQAYLCGSQSLIAKGKLVSACIGDRHFRRFDIGHFPAAGNYWVVAVAAEVGADRGTAIQPEEMAIHVDRAHAPAIAGHPVGGDPGDSANDFAHQLGRIAWWMQSG